jgi:hypothetical protein
MWSIYCLNCELLYVLFNQMDAYARIEYNITEHVSQTERIIQMPLDKPINAVQSLVGTDHKSVDRGQSATQKGKSTTERYSKIKPTNTTNVPRTPDNRIQDPIPAGLPLEEMKDTIKVLQKKVLKLEELLRLKEEQILELSTN